MDKIKELWMKNRDEIIDSITTIKQNEEHGKKKKTEIEDKIKRELRAIKIPLVMGVVYVLAGTVLLLLSKHGSSFTIEPSNVIVGFELLILGIYALLYVLIFYSEYKNWGAHWLLRIIKTFAIFLMFPYHICIKLVKNFIRARRQEHVTYLFPYYFISLLIVMLSYAFIVKIVSGLGIDKAYDAIVGFIIVFILIKEFFCKRSISWCLSAQS